MRQGCPLSPFLFNRVHEFLSSSKTTKRNKRGTIRIRKEEFILLFADDMILYFKEPLDSTRKLE
jgi:hypothetical protein